MPFALIIIGVVLLVTSIRNTYGATTPQGGPGLGTLLQADFTGPNNFVFWVVAILAIGALGYVPKLKGLSTAFLGLVIVVLFLTKGNPSTGSGGGFFAQFSQGLSSTTSAQPSSTSPLGQAQTAASGLGSSLGGLIPSIPSIPNFTP